MSQRSLGITLFAWLNILSGIGGVLYLGFIGIASLVSPTFLGKQPQTILVLLILLAASIFTIILGRKLLQLRLWTRMFIVVYMGLAICWQAGAFIFGGDFHAARWFWTFVEVVWGSLVIWYFLRPSVKAQFQVKQQHSS